MLLIVLLCRIFDQIGECQYSQMAYDQTRALNIDESEAGMSIREIRARMQANEPPATAQEYLLRVRLEADDLGKVIGNQSVKQFSTSSSSIIKPSTILPDFQPCPPKLLPSKKWQRHCASCFAELRQYVVRVQKLDTINNNPRMMDIYNINITLPPMNDGYAWEKLCFGTNSFAVITGKHDPSPVPFEQTVPPLLHVVMSLSIENASKLLRRHVRWLAGNNSQKSENSKQQSKSYERPLTTARAAWLYALLVRVDKPLSREDAAILRTLGRYLSKIRTLIDDVNDTKLPRINVILTLIELGFGQGRV